VIVLSDSVAS